MQTSVTKVALDLVKETMEHCENGISVTLNGQGKAKNIENSQS